MKFGSQREAKEYIVARIVAEAAREGVPLDDIERKMLYFSETGWTLPDILAINEEFERDYNEDAYEQKIAGLAQGIEERDSKSGSDEQAAWDDAVIKLSEGDHYLLALLDSKPVGKANNNSDPGSYDMGAIEEDDFEKPVSLKEEWRMTFMGMAVLAGVIIAIIIGVRIFGR